MIFAGGASENSPNVYYGLNSNNQSIQAYWSWTMTPAYFNNNYSGYQIGMVYGLTQGQLIEIALYRMDYINYIRPVLSLKSCVSWVSGNGTPESPYKVSVDGACSEAVN